MLELSALAARARRAGVPGAGLTGSQVALVHALQTARGEETCFRTEKRWSCTEPDCEWRRECRRLMAEWMR